MCIRDRRFYGLEVDPRSEVLVTVGATEAIAATILALVQPCLLYTSDAADERSSVDLGGRRIIKKKKTSIARKGEQSITAKEKQQT